jgi:hypothetical protein
MENAKEVRAELKTRLDNFLLDLARDMPELAAADTFQFGVGYFADMHARHFGHAATVDMLKETARRGVPLAAEEIAAPRQ